MIEMPPVVTLSNEDRIGRLELLMKNHNYRLKKVVSILEAMQLEKQQPVAVAGQPATSAVQDLLAMQKMMMDVQMQAKMQAKQDYEFYKTMLSDLRTGTVEGDEGETWLKPLVEVLAPILAEKLKTPEQKIQQDAHEPTTDERLLQPAPDQTKLTDLPDNKLPEAPK